LKQELQWLCTQGYRDKVAMHRLPGKLPMLAPRARANFLPIF